MIKRDIDYTIDDILLGKVPAYESVRTPAFVDEFSGSFGDSRTNDQLRQLGQSSRIIAVKPGEDIQAAIDKMAQLENGGTVFLRAGTHTVHTDLVGKSGVNFIGEGVDDTIIDFDASEGTIRYEGESIFINSILSGSTTLSSFSLEGFTVRGSASTGISVKWAYGFKIRNVHSNSNAKGFLITASQTFQMQECNAENNTGDGFSFLPADQTFFSNTDVTRFSLDNCVASTNGALGFRFGNDIPGLGVLDEGNVTLFRVSSCFSEDNASYGFALQPGDAGTTTSGTFISCKAQGNTGAGFFVLDAPHTFVNCAGTSNASGLDFDINADGVTLISPSGQVDLAGATGPQKTTVISPGTGLTLLNFEAINGDFMVADAEINQRRCTNAVNTSGGTLGAGTVVIRKAVADGDEVTTTTTAGDAKVIGVVLASSSNNAAALVLTRGKTTALKVNGTTDIAIGDLLGTHTDAGIAQKAGSGHTAFAMALEAYTANDSSGVIDALLIEPRYVA